MEDVVFISDAESRFNESTLNYTGARRRSSQYIGQEAGNGETNRGVPVESRNRTFIQIGAVCCVIFICTIFAGVLLFIAITRTETIALRNQEGSTYPDADNYQRPYGIDDGSSIFIHPKTGTKRVKFCREDGHTATYYSPGQEIDLTGNGVLREMRATGDIDIDFDVRDMKFKTILGTGTFGLCLDFTLLNLSNAFPVSCSQGDFIQFKNARDPEINGVKFCQRENLPFEKICSLPRSVLEIELTSSTGEPDPGWIAALECGYPGCTQNAYRNYDSSATLDNRTCTSNSGDEDEMTVCGEPGRFYDSGGPTGNYRDNELQGTRFQSGREGNLTCIEIVKFELAPNGAGACTTDFLSLKNYRLGATGEVQEDTTFCNSTDNVPPLGVQFCQVDFETPLLFDFVSNGAETAPGWEVVVSCAGTV